MGIAKLLVLGILPLGSLIYLNIKIYKGVKSPPALLGEGNQRHQRLDQDLAKVLIGIVMIFIVCHTFRIIIEIDNMIVSDIIELCYKAGKPTFTLWSIIVDPLSEVMMILNSSINMIVYCSLNANFRRCILACFGCAKNNKDISNRTRTTSLYTRTSVVSRGLFETRHKSTVSTNQQTTL